MNSPCRPSLIRAIPFLLVFCTLLMIGTTPVQAQDLACGSKVTPEIAQRFLERWNNLPPEYQTPSKDFHACVPIAAHIIRTDEGTGGLPLSQLEQGIIDVNAMYANTGITWYLMPAIDYIDDDDYYYNITTDAEIDAMIQENVVPNACNVYFTPNLTVDDGETGLCGRGSFTTSTPQGVAMNNGCTGVPNNPSTFPHELGHFLDLYHTHETAFGAELVDGTNCATAGDLLCDTPADPLLQTSGPGQNVTSGCSYYGTETDANGDSYNPDTSQLMSYAPKTCRTTMSPMSEAKVVATLTLLRPEIMRCPPVADAGPDQTVECTSPTTTAVMLDGTGSYHPDDLAITYLWEAPGVVFDDATSATPTGQFPKGTTTVTLTVSDGELEGEDTVDITVQDTTPPMITCPAAITVECTSHQGTPQTDEQFDGWFESASASDICCSDPQIDDDAPLYFEMGETTVTFTAEDCDGNTASCEVVVTVEDTTPPTIEVTLDRYALWPPNHKMSEINATVVVEDICCPNPTFVLESVSSSQPDNGNGDGNTVDDIQEADIGTADTEILLRSERSGGDRDGRIYTICYTGIDCVGNTASACVEVHVPHSMGGMAKQVAGFTKDGSYLTVNAQEVTLLLLVDGALDQDVDRKELGIHDAGGVVNPENIYIGNAQRATRAHKVSLAADTDPEYVEVFASFDVQEVRDVLESDPLEYGSFGLYYEVRGKKPYRLVDDVFSLTAAAENYVLEWAGIEESEPLVQENSELPSRGMQLRAAPNPFNPRTEIHFGLQQSGRVSVVIYDIRGQRVTTLMDEVRQAGPTSVVWNGLDHQGRQVATGTYFVQMISADRSEVVKVALVK